MSSAISLPVVRTRRHCQPRYPAYAVANQSPPRKKGCTSAAVRPSRMPNSPPLAIASFAAKRIGLDATVARSAIRPKSAEDFFFSAAAFEAAEEEEDSSDATTAARVVVVVVVVVVIFADTDRVFAAETPRNGDAAPRRRAEDVFATTRAETAEEVIIVVAAIVRANARRVVVCARARLGPSLFRGLRGRER